LSGDRCAVELRTKTRELRITRSNDQNKVLKQYEVSSNKISTKNVEQRATKKRKQHRKDQKIKRQEKTNPN